METKNLILDLSEALKEDRNYKPLFSAIINTIPIEELSEANDQLRYDHLIDFGLLNTIRQRVEGLPAREKKKNEPIGTLLKMFSDKRSKKVGYARPLLQGRYEKQSYRDQNRILSAFLDGCRQDIQWAGSILHKDWRKEFKGKVAETWNREHVPALARIILDHFPTDYVQAQADAIIKTVKYCFLCARLGNEPTFTVDETRLSTPDYFYVAAKLGWKPDVEKMEGMLKEYLANLKPDRFVNADTPISLLSLLDVRIMVWAMGVLGMKDTLLWLWDFIKQVEQDVPPAYTFDSHWDCWWYMCGVAREKLGYPPKPAYNDYDSDDGEQYLIHPKDDDYRKTRIVLDSDFE